MLFDEIQKGETDSLEFKRDMPDDHLKFLKTAVAFANCNGGRIVFGVDDDRSIVGVDPLGAFRLADRVVDTISNSCAPQMAVSTEVATVARKNVVVVSVPMGMSTPYFIKSLGKANGTFVRVGATTRLADEDTVSELEFTGAGKTFDSQVCRGLDISEKEIGKLCNSMYRLARANCEKESEKRDVRKVTAAQLEDWGVLVRSGDKLLPTYAFALLAGSRKFWSEVQCAVFRGETKANFIDRREFTGPITRQLDQAFDYALSKINMGMELHGIYRHDVYEIPPGAIRELIVNALVHRQYINPHAASIQVALYDTHLDITSPGGLPHGMTVELMNEGHSRARNKALALACRYMRLIEEWGSGIPRIRQMLADAGLKPLEVINNGISVTFRLWRPFGNATTVKTMGKADEKNDAVTENVTRNVTRNVARKTKLQKDILDSVAGKLGITQEELAQRFGVARMTIMRNMARLVSEGLLRHVGPDKGGHWEVATPHEAENHHD